MDTLIRYGDLLWALPNSHTNVILKEAIPPILHHGTRDQYRANGLIFTPVP